MRGMWRAMALALAGGLLAMVPAGPAWAPRECGHCGPAVLGMWDGSYQGVGNPTDRGSLALEVTSQQGRRFGGTLTGLGGPDTIPVEGTVARSGQLSLVGRDQGEHVVVQGEVVDPDQGGIGNPDIFEGRFALTGPGGTEGDLVLVHATGFPGEALAGLGRVRHRLGRG